MLMKFEAALTLPVLWTKSNDDDVGVLDQSLGAQVVHAGPNCIPIAPLFLHAQNDRPTVITVFVAGVGRREGDGQLLLGNALSYHFAPIAVNFATQVNLPNFIGGAGGSGSGREYPT